MSQKISQISINLLYCMLIILITMILNSTSIPNLVGNFCSNTTMFVNNSQYQIQLNTLFNFLSSNATETSGFHQAISSDTNSSSETIYGSFLCRGDLNVSTCQDCVTTATTIDLPKSLCPNRKEAIIWYDECMVRYSNASYFGQVESSPSVFSWNLNNVTGNTTRFMELMTNMMINIIAPTAAAGDQSKKFATYYVSYTDFQTIYGLGQCTPDLTSLDCSVCLTNAISSFRATPGGRVFMPSCVARYEIYPFFNLSSLPPGRQNTTGKVTNITITNNCNYTVWPATTGNTDVNVPTGFSLAEGQSKTISFQSNQEVRVWGRTLCSDDTDSFSCQTGDCGTGRIDCNGASFKHPATVAYFSINQIPNKDTYDVRVNYGYNLQMMVAPNDVRGNGNRCTVTGCVFNLNHSKCSPEYRVMDTDTATMIGCNNPCDVERQFCCQNSSICDDSEYSLIPSFIFSTSCPRAHITPFDGSTTRFSCDNVQGTSYTVMFCPPPNMTSELSVPFSSNQNSPLVPSPANVPLPTSKVEKSKVKLVVSIVVPLTVSTLLISLCTYLFRKKTKEYLSPEARDVLEDMSSTESLMFELETLEVATNYFSEDLKLGGGGFGNVYQGTLLNGQQIAVKRLSRFSNQGADTFKNEAVLIAKLQHKNLVRLLGFCIGREERLLVYEYLPNKSLDYFLFDRRKQSELDWTTRYKIITGIARGLLYLHEDSRPRIIHRDLKAANILLEADMNPKISDFGLARIFKVEQTEDETSIVAGTYGYMAPEYAMHGQFSTKSDVYSFGVLLLEIISGKKINSKFNPSGDGDLLSHAWRSWKYEILSEFVDQTLQDDSYSRDEVLRCIYLGLSCVQENADDRPTMSTVVFMLNTNSSTSALPIPKRPRSFYHSSSESSQTMSNQYSATTSSSKESRTFSRNQLTISEINPS